MKWFVFCVLLSASVVYADEQCVNERIRIEDLTQQNAQLILQLAQQSLARSVAEKGRLESLQKPAEQPAPAEQTPAEDVKK
jgi:hypothetical protein